MAEYDSARTGWPIAPVDLRLSEGAVDVWLISLVQRGAPSEAITDLLSFEEQERAASFKFDLHRRRFILAHAAVRSILGHYLQTSPKNLQFVHNANGKPSLAAEHAGSGVKFNLTHSHELALLAVTQNREVGIDIEHVKEDYAFDEVAVRFFTGKELAAFRALPAHLQRRAFFKCWTSKESFLKAKGTGLSGKLDEVEITAVGDDRVRIDASVPGWTLMELDPTNHYEAALVVEGEPPKMRLCRW